MRCRRGCGHLRRKTNQGHRSWWMLDRNEGRQRGADFANDTEVLESKTIRQYADRLRQSSSRRGQNLPTQGRSGIEPAKTPRIPTWCERGCRRMDLSPRTRDEPTRIRTNPRSWSPAPADCSGTSEPRPPHPATRSAVQRGTLRSGRSFAQASISTRWVCGLPTAGDPVTGARRLCRGLHPWGEERGASPVLNLLCNILELPCLNKRMSVCLLLAGCWECAPSERRCPIIETTRSPFSLMTENSDRRGSRSPSSSPSVPCLDSTRASTSSARP